jgi:hypothetical protein
VKSARYPFLAAALLACGCSGGDTGEEVPPLPEQTAQTGNALMAEAERAAGNASRRAETAGGVARSDRATINEVTP